MKLLRTGSGKNKPLKIGITGCMGSGKSVVARVFQTLGVPVFFSDEAARILMETDEVLKEKIRDLLGEEAYQNGVLNKLFVRERVFTNDALRIRLNDLVHHLVCARFDAWAMRQNGHYVLKESALIFQTIVWQRLDKIIWVKAPVSLCAARLQTRDNISAEEAMRRIALQYQYNDFTQSDGVLHNDEQASVLEAVRALHRYFEYL